jgi:hypothetical protein
VVLLIGIAAGSFLEDKFDFIGRGRRNKRIRKSIEVALACVYEAEQDIGGGRGEEKFALAIGLYQEKTGNEDYRKAFHMVMKAFEISNLSKNG